jgi:RecA/RadA recombinase
MAKEKKAKEEVEVKESAIYKELKKKYGNVIKSGLDIVNEKKGQKVISISPVLDLALGGGVREGTWTIMSGNPKCGKAQPLDSVVYTPSGPKQISEIYVNDQVCTPDGKTSFVTGVFPQGKKDVYKINFSDGTSAKCCGEHLWYVRPNYANSQYRVVTASDMYGDCSYANSNKWVVPVPEFVFFRKRDVTIDPYFMGILLAYGRIFSEKIYMKSLPPHLVPVVAKFAQQYGCEYVNSYLIDRSTSNEMSGIIAHYLRSIGANYGHMRKRIHDFYKYNDEETRLKLIQGLFTKNAYQHSVGYIEFKSRNKLLAQDVMETIRSLGYICKMYRDTKVFRISINTDAPYEFLNKVKDKVTKRKIHKTISHIEKLEEKESCVCISIEDKNGLYITDGLNVTHNTTTAMQLAYHCQKEGRPVIWINSEGRLSDMNFEIEGIDPSKIQIITAEDRALSAEEYLDITEKLVSAPENKGAVCVIDSVSSLIPSKELDNDVTGSMRPGLPKILSNFCKKLGQIVPNNNVIMILITHLITDTGGYGGKMADGGVKIQYQADNKMKVKKIEPWESKDGSQIGQSVHWKIECSSFGAHGECVSWIRYGQGVDMIQELLNIAEEMSIVEKSGSWYYLKFLGEEVKFQGLENVYNHLKENPEDLCKLNDKVKEMLS